MPHRKSRSHQNDSNNRLDAAAKKKGELTPEQKVTGVKQGEKNYKKTEEQPEGPTGSIKPSPPTCN